MCAQRFSLQFEGTLGPTEKTADFQLKPGARVFIQTGMEWFYASGSNRVGPVTPVAFQGLLKDNVIRADTLVWSQGMPEWRPWGDLSAETAVCAASNGRYWTRDMVPYEGQFVSAEHKEAYFQRLREGVAQPHEVHYAGFWIRFLAKFLDGIITGVVTISANFALSMLMFGSIYATRQPGDNTTINLTMMVVYQVVTMLFNTGVTLLYSWYFLSRKGATPGKMALGLKVIRADGTPLTNGRIIGRFFAEWLSSLILLIGYIMAGFDDEKRALHDHICDTRVIVEKK